MTDAANLEDGFYWVRFGDEWHVAHIFDEGHHMELHGSSALYSLPFWFDEIDPRPIKREDVK